MQAGRKRARVIPGTDAEPVTAQDEFRTLARAHGVPVNADDAGQGPAVGFHVGRAVMGLGSDYVMVVVVKAGHAGIVPEDRDHPVFLPLNFRVGASIQVLKRLSIGTSSPVARSRY